MVSFVEPYGRFDVLYSFNQESIGSDFESVFLQITGERSTIEGIIDHLYAFRLLGELATKDLQTAPDF